MGVEGERSLGERWPTERDREVSAVATIWGLFSRRKPFLEEKQRGTAIYMCVYVRARVSGSNIEKSVKCYRVRVVVASRERTATKTNCRSPVLATALVGGPSARNGDVRRTSASVLLAIGDKP